MFDLIVALALELHLRYQHRAWLHFERITFYLFYFLGNLHS